MPIIGDAFAERVSARTLVQPVACIQKTIANRCEHAMYNGGGEDLSNFAELLRTGKEDTHLHSLAQACVIVVLG